MDNHIFIISLLFYISILNLQGVLSQAEGEPCTSKGKPGICRIFTSCPAAVQRLYQSIDPVFCSSHRRRPLPLVCCELETTTTTQPVLQTDSRGSGKSYQKCKEYAEYIDEWVYPPTGFGPKVKLNSCAQVAQALVVGGEDALPREFPHMAALGFIKDGQINWRCGGSLISENFVLTAAHCHYREDLGEVKRVRVGDLNLDRTDDIAKPQEFDVAKFIPHPEHKPPSQYNDIALIRLAGLVKLNPFVVPACLRWDPKIQQKKAIATGWGKLNHSSTTHSSSLQKVTLELFNQDECNTAYEPFISHRSLGSGIVPNTQLCAGSHKEEIDTCGGDSGGPLQVFQMDDIYCMYSLVGVTSFGSVCADVGTPGVYTRVSAYVPWIESIVWS